MHRSCTLVFLILSTLSATFAQDATTEPTSGRAAYVGDELIKDYDPQPALVTKETRVDKPKFPVIDIHCHWTMQQNPQQLLKAMDELNVETSNNLSGGFGADLDEMLLKFHSVAPERLLIFANVDFSRVDEPGFGEQQAQALRDARKKGVSGLKIFKTLGLTINDGSGKIVPSDDPRLDPIWDVCAELHMPVLIHAADPAPFFEPIDAHNERWMQLKRHPDWSFYGPEFPKRDEIFAKRDRMIAKNPKTVFIEAHLSDLGDDLERLKASLDRSPNVYVDFSGRVSELGRQPYAAREFLLKYQDRVLFGTDRYPGRPDQPRHRVYYRFLESNDEYFKYYDAPFPPSGDWRIYGVHLPDEALKKIYHDNAERALRGELPIAVAPEPHEAH